MKHYVRDRSPNPKEFRIQWLELPGFLQGSLVYHQIYDNVPEASKMPSPLKV